MIKKVLKSITKSMGYKIEKITSLEKENLFTMQKAMSRCVKRGLKINTVIDVGASNGSWSIMCMDYFPNANYLLIEANDGHKIALEKMKSSKNANYIMAAAGEKNGKIYFDNSDLFSGLASETPFSKNCIEVPVICIDDEINNRKLAPPYLIKLDTHGFEVPILKGALNTIKSSELLVIETYNYQLTKDSLKYWEMCQYLERLGFSSIENVDFMLRDFDSSFWQMDSFFIKSTSKEFAYNSFG